MFSWLKSRRTEPGDARARALYDVVRRAVTAGGRDEDDVHIRIVGATAALLACVAYADLEVEASEEEVIRVTLGRIQGLDEAGVAAIVAVMRQDVVRIASAEATTYARELLELTDETFRRQLLDVLVDVAAADDEITVSETNMLRGVARAFGLPSAAYNESQSRHRDKLAVLKGEPSR
ncbi:MAG: TerB family tellurite resistance protein [Myxococcota bacterium]